jgi:5-methyltetrahydropteroyltriglutamate--homocysteine methyltransferase
LVAEQGTTVAPQVVGEELRQRERISGRDAAFLKQHSQGPFKVTLPSAAQGMTMYRVGLTDKVYPTPADLLADLVRLHQDEARALADDGVPYIQLDSLRYLEMIDPDRRAQARADGRDPDQTVDETIAADNAVLGAARRPGVTLAMHICRGNNRSAWIAEGSYELVAEKLFGQLAVDRFLLEYDTERAGGFEPLRFVPRGKTVVLGLISSKEPTLESVDDLRRRIDEAARYVGHEDLALSPQCGFASSMLGNLLTPDEQWRKLDLVAETAQRVWGD